MIVNVTAPPSGQPGDVEPTCSSSEKPGECAGGTQSGESGATSTKSKDAKSGDSMPPPPVKKEAKVKGTFLIAAPKRVQRGKKVPLEPGAPHFHSSK